MSKICTNCGNQLNDNAMFCTACGTKVGQNDQAQNTQPTVQAETDNQNNFQQNFDQSSQPTDNFQSGNSAAGVYGNAQPNNTQPVNESVITGSYGNAQQSFAQNTQPVNNGVYGDGQQSNQPVNMGTYGDGQQSNQPVNMGTYGDGQQNNQPVNMGTYGNAQQNNAQPVNTGAYGNAQQNPQQSNIPLSGGQPMGAQPMFGQQPQQQATGIYGNAKQNNFQPNNGMGNGSVYGNAQQPNAMQMNNGGATAGGSKKPLFIVLGALAALIAVGIICFFVFFRSTYKTPIDNLMKVMNSGSGSALEKLIPETYRDQLDDMGIKLGDYYDNMAQEIHQQMEDELGKGYKITYEVLEKNPMKLSEMESYADDLSDSSTKKVSITEAYKVKIKLSAKTKDGTDTDTKTLHIGKVDGDWCILNFDSFV